MAKRFLTIITLIIISLSVVACSNRETDTIAMQYDTLGYPAIETVTDPENTYTVCEYTIMVARDAMNRVWQELTIPQGQAGAFDIDATIVQAIYDDEPFIMTTEINLQMITDGFRTERLLTYELLSTENYTVLGILQLYTIEEGNDIISFLFFVDGIETYYDENYASLGIERLWDILFSNIPDMPIERLRISTIEITENGNTVIDVFIHAQEELDYVRDVVGDYAPYLEKYLEKYLENFAIRDFRNTIILDSNSNPQGVATEMRFRTRRSGIWTGYSTTITLTFNAFGEDVEIRLP
ncbi:MAG: hypothetical protein FWB96_07575 [Defluviitaleaceae bacterium]|nr:hypothetical protein [Defluviitaleaceae bacterium]MCL2262784.1 hypothetical protein [Defluviitaleaceae bacterium]